MSKKNKEIQPDKTEKPETLEPADLDEVTGGFAGGAPAGGSGLGMSWNAAGSSALLQSGHHAM